MRIQFSSFMGLLYLTACSQEASIVTPPKTIPVTEVVEAVPDIAFSCPHSETRDIFFTSTQTPDKLHIQILGKACDTARIKMQIVTLNGQTVHSSEARALDYTYEDEGPKGVERMLENLVTTQSQLNALISYGYDMKAEHSGYSNVNHKAVMHHKTNQAPLFCHRAGKSYSRCFVYLNDKTVMAFTSGS